MTDNLHYSISLSNGSPQNISRSMAEAHDPTTAEVPNRSAHLPDLALEIQALQILDSSDDCIKVLDLEGRILYMNQGGQALLGIEDITPALNTSWVNFWQESEQQAAMEAIAKAATGEVCSLQGYCPTMKGEPKWWDNKISPILGADGKVERLLCISRDITDRKLAEDERQQTEAALRASEEQFRLFTAASSDTIYKYIPPEEQSRVMAAIAEAIRTKSTFELEHRVIQQDGAIGWTFSRAIPLLNEQGEIVEWLGAASDVTARKQVALNAEFLATVTQDLAEATCVEDIIQTVGEQLHRYLQVSNCAFVEISESKEVAAIHHSWHLKEVASLVGDYQLAEFVTDEFFQMAKAGQTIIVRDVETDSRIAEPERFAALKIGSFVNVPLIRDNEWKFTLGIYHQTPYNWRSDEIELMRELANRIWTKLERARAEAALRKSEALHRTLFDSIDEGACLLERLPIRPDGLRDYRYIALNPALQAMFGNPDLSAQSIRDNFPDETEDWYDDYDRVLETGQPMRFERESEPQGMVLEMFVTRVEDSSGQRLLAVMQDVTNRKRAEEALRESEERQAFLLKFSDSLRGEPDADAVANGALRMLSQQMQLDRCYIGVYRLADDRGDFTHQVGNDRVPPLPDGVRLSDFPDALRVAFNQTLVIDDIAETEELTDTDRQNLGALRLRALVAATLREGEKNPLWSIVAISASPRRWTRGEVALLEEATERTWVAMERARTESALRESEAKYRSLFTSIDEGFNLLAMIPDESGHPADFRILETNPAWEQQTGLTDATGKTLLEIAPNFEQQLLDFYRDVVTSGRGRRTEYYTASVDRWYTVHASRIGGEGSCQVAVVFNDITDRKRAEEQLRESAERQQFLLNFSDTLRVLPDKDTIERTSLQLLAEYLQLDRVYIAAVYSSDDRAVIGPEYYRPDLIPMAGEVHLSDFPEAFRIVEEQTLVIENVADHPSLSDLDRQSFGAINFAALVVASARRGERNVIWSILAAMTTPRNWTAGEVALLETVAERTWAAVERAKAEQSLRTSEEKYRSLFESMDEAYAVVEVLADDNGWNDFLFLEVNPAFVKQTGMEYPVGRKATELLGTPNPRWAEVFGRVAETGEPIRFEESEATLSRVFDLYVFRLGGDGSRRVAVLFTNITDRKQVEAAIAADLRDTQLLRDLSARLATEENIHALYQEIMAAAIALTQADAGTVQILDEMTQDLVLLATQGISQKMVEHFHRVNASSHTSCGIALRSEVRSFVDFDVPESEDPDGSMRLHVEGGLLSAQSTPLVSRSGRPIGMVSTHWRTHHRPSDRELRFLDLLARQAADLIEQRQAEAQRKQLLEREQAAREEAEQANRIKDEFLAVLSHELRSPLNPILGWSTLLLKGKLDTTKTTQALTTIQRNAKLQSELIEDLLDVSRILRGKLNLNVASVNLASVIRGAMETVRLAAEAKSIQIGASLTEDVGLVSGDSTRLQQVVWNLLSNAVKFTPQGGQVNIRLERFDSSAQIMVSDTGQGIAPDFLPYVFDYFRQADGATTRKFGGLGLGLAIVRHLVELHGGTVRVESPGEGQGATFTVRLPLMSTSSEVNQDERSPQPSLDLKGIKILVVDDETDARELVAFVLGQQGAQVTTAASAYEALLLLSQAKPDVLLSDIGMPEMDGYMLIRQVRTLAPEQGGQIPAIALTAYAGDTNQQQVLAAGFQKHISKPIEPEELVQAIAQVHPH